MDPLNQTIRQKLLNLRDSTALKILSCTQWLRRRSQNLSGRRPQEASTFKPKEDMDPNLQSGEGQKGWVVKWCTQDWWLEKAPNWNIKKKQWPSYQWHQWCQQTWWKEFLQQARMLFGEVWKNSTKEENNCAEVEESSWMVYQSMSKSLKEADGNDWEHNCKKQQEF